MPQPEPKDQLKRISADQTNRRSAVTTPLDRASGTTNLAPELMPDVAQTPRWEKGGLKTCQGVRSTSLEFVAGDRVDAPEALSSGAVHSQRSACGAFWARPRSPKGSVGWPLSFAFGSVLQMFWGDVSGRRPASLGRSCGSTEGQPGDMQVVACKSWDDANDGHRARFDARQRNDNGLFSPD